MENISSCYDLPELPLLFFLFESITNSELVFIARQFVVGTGVPAERYDVWHDRATFHFLVTPQQINSYISTASNAVTGYMTIGTFSDNGPKKCSGLDIRQYTENELQDQLSQHFSKIRCITEDHTTPFDTTQNFLFCSFKKQA